MKESRLYKPVELWVKKSYPSAFTYRASDKFIMGIPDIICCADGLFVSIEVKENHHVTKIQEAIMNKIHGAAGIALVVKKDSVWPIQNPELKWEWKTTSLKEIISCLKEK